MRSRSIVAVGTAALLAAVVALLAPSRRSSEVRAPRPRSPEAAATPAAEPEGALFQLDRFGVEVLEPDALESELAPTPSVDAASEGGTRLYGFVLPDPRRGELDGAPGVSATDRWAERTAAMAAADGAYSIPGLTPGRYWISAGSNIQGWAHEVVELVDGEDERRLDLQLTALPEVWVRVVDTDGESLPRYALLAVATREPPGEWFDAVRGSWNNPFGVGCFYQNGSGSEQRDDSYLGRVALAVDPPVYVSLVHFQRVVATQRVERGQLEITFELERESTLLQPGSVRARFVDASTHEPVTKGQAMLDAVGSKTTPLGESGEVRFTRCSPGRAMLKLLAAGYADPRLGLRLEPGVELDLGDVAVEPALWIAGRITDEEGAGVQAVLRIEFIYPDSDASVPTDGSYVHKSLSDGSFRIEGLARGAFRLSYFGPSGGYAPFDAVFDTTSGPLDDVHIELRHGVPLVVRASREDWRSVRITILDATGARVLSSRLWSPAPQKILLAPGSYDVAVQLAEGQPTRLPITLTNGPVELLLP